VGSLDCSVCGPFPSGDTLNHTAELAELKTPQIPIEVTPMSTTLRRSAIVAGAVSLCLLAPSISLQAQRGGSVLELMTSEGNLSVGAEFSSALSSSDTRSQDDSYMEAWTIEGQPGESVTIDLIADDFDPVLYVTGPGLEATLYDDDSGGACYSRITFTYLESGTFRLVASSNSPRATGTYVLRVSETPGPTAGYACGGMDPTVLLGLPTEGRTLSLGELYSGSLTGLSPTIGDGKKAQAWSLEGRAGEAVSVTLVSDDFDTYLYLTGPGLDDVLSDDDGAGDLNSLLTVSFPEDAVYTVVASSLGSGTTGSYTIRVDEPTDMRDLPTDGRTLSLGETANGYLATTDPVIEEGRRGQAWVLEGKQGDTYTVDMLSDDFDCFLYVIGPGLSEPMTNDDGAGDLDSRITITFPFDGAYVVIASALSSGEGAYQVQVEEAVGLNDLPTEGRVVQLDRLMTGWLTESDAIVDQGRYGQAWALEGRGGETYTIDLMSDDYDCYLYVVGPGMLNPRTDDDGGEGLDSRLTVTLPEDGTYRIVASALSLTGSGDYSLRVTGRGN
jgi:hypothetical protein